MWGPLSLQPSTLISILCIAQLATGIKRWLYSSPLPGTPGMAKCCHLGQAVPSKHQPFVSPGWALGSAATDAGAGSGERGTEIPLGGPKSEEGKTPPWTLHSSQGRP